MTKEEQKAVEEFTEMNLTKKGLYHYNDMQDAFLIGLFKGENMHPSLPSDIDEAAEEFGKRQGIELASFARKFFKAGAEWMAGQGQTIVSLVWRDEDDKLFIEAFVDENEFKMADKIIIQIRKKS